MVGAVWPSAIEKEGSRRDGEEGRARAPGRAVRHGVGTVGGGGPAGDCADLKGVVARGQGLVAPDFVEGRLKHQVALGGPAREPKLPGHLDAGEGDKRAADVDKDPGAARHEEPATVRPQRARRHGLGKERRVGWPAVAGPAAGQTLQKWSAVMVRAPSPWVTVPHDSGDLHPRAVRSGLRSTAGVSSRVGEQQTGGNSPQVLAAASARVTNERLACCGVLSYPDRRRSVENIQFRRIDRQ
jgi:hypothetical protein